MEQHLINEDDPGYADILAAFTCGFNLAKMDEDKRLHKDCFYGVVYPAMKYLKDNHHPHTKIIVDSDNAEIVEGLRSVSA